MVRKILIMISHNIVLLKIRHILNLWRLKKNILNFFKFYKFFSENREREILEF